MAGGLLDLKHEALLHDGSFKFYDKKRQTEARIIAGLDDYRQAFAELSQGCLEGVAWENMLVVGNFPFTVLHSEDPAWKDHLADPAINLVFNGLTPSEANAKVQAICASWEIGATAAADSPPGEAKYFAFKNLSKISLVGKWPFPRIKIWLKLYDSAEQTLNACDLDVCGIGYNGTDVLLSPRFCRAMETRYSIFNMSMVWGHELGRRLPTTDIRSLKYANIGFGVRILPAYLETLEEVSGCVDGTKVLSHKIKTLGCARNIKREVGSKSDSDKRPGISAAHLEQGMGIEAGMDERPGLGSLEALIRRYGDCVW